MSLGTPITGGAPGSTVTVNAFVPLTFPADVAEHVTVVVAIAKVEPDPGLQLTGSLPPAGSAAVTV